VSEPCEEKKRRRENMQHTDIHEKKARLEEGSSEVLGRAKGGAMSMLEKRRMEAADSLGSVAKAFRRSSAELRGEDPTASRYSEFAANQVEHLAGYLRGDVDQVMDRMERFARRRPEVFLGGAFAAGFILSRFLKSSRPEGGYAERHGAGEYGPRSLGDSATRGEWTRESGEPELPRERPIPTAPGVGPT
jgi:hypothetical protein